MENRNSNGMHYDVPHKNSVNKGNTVNRRRVTSSPNTTHSQHVGNQRANSKHTNIVKHPSTKKKRNLAPIIVTGVILLAVATASITSRKNFGSFNFFTSYAAYIDLNITDTKYAVTQKHPAVVLFSHNNTYTPNQYFIDNGYNMINNGTVTKDGVTYTYTYKCKKNVNILSIKKAK